MTKQDIQKQLDAAYTALSNLKDRKAHEAGDPTTTKSERVLQTHIRYLKHLLQEAS